MKNPQAIIAVNPIQLHNNSNLHPKPSIIIEKRQPAPTPQWQAEQFGRGHPGRVKERGGGRRAEEGMRPDDMRQFNNIISHPNG